MAKNSGCPVDWQEKVTKKLEELYSKGPVHGVILPASWRAELGRFHQQLYKMFGVKSVSFGGTTITALEPSTEDK